MKIKPDIRKTIIRGIFFNAFNLYCCYVLGWAALSSCLIVLYAALEWYRIRLLNKAIIAEQILAESLREHLRSRQASQQLELEAYRISQSVNEILNYCYRCKYYYGQWDINCAVHPEGKEDCQDWEE